MSAVTWWLIAALALAGMEMLTGTFYLLAIAAGAAFGALAALTGIPPAGQIAIAALFSLIALGGLKHWKRKTAATLPPEQSLDIGHIVLVENWLDATRARVRHRGTQWDAELRPPLTGPVDAELRIVAQRGATLILDLAYPRSESQQQESPAP
ncbi:NfeD family protein [Chitiniphilus eburneus]|uniref:NfeD family protein n=1 Tax=Chitiniphilus eburneus TaxID=2571148 RepID=A0A4U0PZ29_9NEIS|nr:NfeD family protein [Chitiniphilus eburneus]TJZ73857.1 NfeD family protein [Chitiniphilus eburneus]